jgi:hypothetical protein
MRLGIQAGLYVNTNTYDSPTWLEVLLISDLTVNANWQEGESSTRAARVQTFEQTIMAMELTGRVRKETTNTAYLALRTAHGTASVVDFLVLDAKNTVFNGDGYRFHGRVFNFGEDQSLGNVVFKEFSAKPCVYIDGDGNQVPPKTAFNVAGTLTYGTIGA